MSFLKEYIKMKTVMNYYKKELYDNLRSNNTTDEEVKNSTKDNKMNNKMDKKMIQIILQPTSELPLGGSKLERK